MVNAGFGVALERSELDGILGAGTDADAGAG
jgi:hypothetical protein